MALHSYQGALIVVLFAAAWWLGLYLLHRDPAKPVLRFVSLGLLAYALALAAQLLYSSARSPGVAELFFNVYTSVIFFPALFWSGALIQLVADASPRARGLARLWSVGLIPIVCVALLGGLFSARRVGHAPTVPPAAIASLPELISVLLPLATSYLLVLRNLPALRPSRALGLTLAATLFFALGTGMLLLPANWSQVTWMVLGLGLDLLLLGYSIALLDAFDEGESLWPDLRRSGLAALLGAALFGSQVVLAMLLATGPTPAMIGLLLTSIASAITLQVFSPRLQRLLDSVAFAGMPALRQAREELRTAETVLPRIRTDIDFATVDEAEFTRLVRRALSNYGDLTKLATSPLTALPLLVERVAQRGAPQDPLERAIELKALLAESIERLKPRGKGDFGTSDEWRFYNALYFPYILGLKPYSRRATGQAPDDPVARAAIAWLQSTVPERTLYNWQTAASSLVSHDLRCRLEQVRGSTA